MTFEKLSSLIHKAIYELQEDKLKLYTGTLVIDNETWKVSFKRTSKRGTE